MAQVAMKTLLFLQQSGSFVTMAANLI